MGIKVKTNIDDANRELKEKIESFGFEFVIPDDENVLEEENEEEEKQQ